MANENESIIVIYTEMNRQKESTRLIRSKGMVLRKNNKCFGFFFLYRCFTYILLYSVTKCKIRILSECHYLTTNSQQPIEQQDDWNNSYHDSGVVFSERGPESHHQDWAREAEGHHNRKPSEPLVRENPQDLLLKCEYNIHIFTMAKQERLSKWYDDDDDDWKQMTHKNVKFCFNCFFSAWKTLWRQILNRMGSWISYLALT